MKYVIFDLDNCLADDRERIPLINWSEPNLDKRYAEYHRDVSDDYVGNFSVYEERILKEGNTPIFMTARPHTVFNSEWLPNGRSNVRQQTLDWIKDRLGEENPILLMRNVGDHKPSVELKQEQLGHVASWDIDHCDIVCAYDDRSDIVAMYRENGINAQVLAIHDECAYSQPAPVRSAKRAPDFLEDAAATFRQRNALYGDNYLRFGAAFLSIFPGSKIPEIANPADMDRLQLLMQILNKVTRYAENLTKGGHQDSARDICVYAAMLEEMTDEK